MVASPITLVIATHGLDARGPGKRRFAGVHFDRLAFKRGRATSAVAGHRAAVAFLENRQRPCIGHRID
jgi:hypothetical protein